MNHIKFAIIFFISVFSFLSCSPTPSKFMGIVNRLRNNIAEEIKNKYDLELIGIGGSMPDCVLHYFTLSFAVQKNVNLDEARRLILNVAHEYLDLINNNVEIKYYMLQYPFDEKNVDIAIFFKNPDNTSVQHPYISIASFCEGKLWYMTHNDREKLTYKTKFNETYQEAIERFKQVQRNEK